MADNSDVQNALAALVANVLYPEGNQGAGGWGSAQAGGWAMAAAYGSLTAMLNSVAGLQVRIYRGWPVAQQLDPDLANGIAHVTVFGQNGGRIDLGNLDPDIGTPGPAPTVTATVSGSTVLLAGTVTPLNTVGVIVNGTAVTYAAQQGDTLLSVASALAANMPVPATAALVTGGVLVTIATTRPIVARTGSPGTFVRRPRQQTERFMVTVWAPTPAARDAVGKLVDATLSDTRWLTLPDQKARLTWAGTGSNDVTSKSALWRRDVFYAVNYWTTLTRSAPSTLFGITNVTGGLGSVIGSAS